tara:strand:+ start:20293 stop:20655 length:363 start_codon:yes stop_codon:yes gene_type:complete
MQPVSINPDTFARQWLDAWNRHSLEDILAHYQDDVVFRSPMIPRITGAREGILRGKPALRAYWGQALAALPDLRFELLDVLSGYESVTLYYKGHRGNVAETFLFGDQALVRESIACYAAG